MIVAVGKDVKDLAQGDRCVADPTLTVRASPRCLTVLTSGGLLMLCARTDSAVAASTAEEASLSCARTSGVSA